MRTKLFPITLLAGVAAGLIRACEWRWAWEDAERGLMKLNYWLSLLLLGVTLVFFLSVLLVARGAPKRHDSDWDVSDLKLPAPLLGWAGMAGVLALLVSAALDIRKFITVRLPGEPLSELSSLIFAVLSVFAGITVLIVIRAASRRTLKRSYGIYMLVPVFWACFWLVRDIGRYAIDPIQLRFFYDMMGAIFALLSLYAAAGFFYSQARTRRTLVYCSMGIFFSLITLLGAGLYCLLWGGLPADSQFHAADLCRFGFVLLYLPAIQLTADRSQ